MKSAFCPASNCYPARSPRPSAAPPARSTSARPASGVPSGGCCTKRTSAAVRALHRGPLGCSNRCRGCPCMESSSASSCGPVSWPSCHRLSADGTKPEVRQQNSFLDGRCEGCGAHSALGPPEKGPACGVGPLVRGGQPTRGASPLRTGGRPVSAVSKRMTLLGEKSSCL